MLQRVGPTALPVLVRGDTGTGKELVAQALHAASGRYGPLVAFNVCAIGESMFEDALFGHVRGAFTGAVNDVPGYLAEADKGTVFLDEIGALPLTVQAKLLRVLETKSFRPVGARADRRSDFRIVSATNDDLETLVESGRFRADLAHRLSGVTLLVPPLDTRQSDIPMLARRFARDAGAPAHLSESALNALAQRKWPGNVRQLRNAVELLVGLCAGEILATDVQQILPDDTNRSQHTHTTEEPEARRLRTLLDESAWSIQTAARALGVHQATVYRRMQRHGLRPGGHNRLDANIQ